MRRALVSVCICVLALYSGGVWAAERPAEEPAPALPNLPVGGYGLGTDGRAFAYLQGIGLVGEGDVIEYKWKKDVYKVRILVIRKDELTVKVLGVKDRPPPPKRRRVKPRDPFWPVGYQAWEIVGE